MTTMPWPPKTLRICGVTVEHGLCCRFLQGHAGPHEVRKPRAEPPPSSEPREPSENIKFYAWGLPDRRTWWW